MSKSKKILIIISAAAVILGCIIGSCGLAAIDFDFTRLNTIKYETNIRSFSENINNINIDVSSADIVFKLSETGKCEVECYDDEKVSYDINVTNDTLNISHDKKWNIVFFGFNFSSPKITVCLPEKEYGTLNIQSGSSDIYVPDNISFKNAEIYSSSGEINYFAETEANLTAKTSSGNINVSKINASYLSTDTMSGDIDIYYSNITNDFKVNSMSGEITLSEVSAFNISAESMSGDIEFTNVIVAENINAKSQSGDIDLIRSDAENLYISTSSGDVSGSLLSEKTFITDTNSGDVDVPNYTGSPNVCEVKTSSGDIDFSLLFREKEAKSFWFDYT